MKGKVLVAGGAGYIGSHVCKALAEAGAVPVCCDTLENGHEWAVRWGPLERGDVGDPDFLGQVFARHRPSSVIHLAGYIQVGESVHQPERYMHNNVTKSEVLIAAALKHRVDAFVFSSSCAVYGVPETELLDETHPFRPISPYAESKARVEKLLDDAAGRGLRAASLRYFNAAGADRNGEIGEAHEPESHLMPLAIDAVLGFAPALTLLGTDYPTPDGTCVRDYVHVTDLADAHLRAVDWLGRTKSPSHEAFNIGSGSGYSVKELLDEAGRVAGKPVPHRIGPRRAGDPPKLVGDIAKSRRELGWQPTRDLTVQIEDTIAWRRKMPR